MAEPDYRRNLTLDDFDEHGCLKITFGLWLVIVYLCRHVVLLVLGAASSFANFTYGQRGANYSVVFSDPWLLMASAPALVVLFAAVRRTPSAPRLLRTLWRAGRLVLVLAASLDLAVLAALVGLGGLTVQSGHIAQGFFDVLCLLYLTRTQRVKDTFADFPGAKGEGKNGASPGW